MKDLLILDWLSKAGIRRFIAVICNQDLHKEVKSKLTWYKHELKGEQGQRDMTKEFLMVLPAILQTVVIAAPCEVVDIRRIDGGIQKHKLPVKAKDIERYYANKYGRDGIRIDEIMNPKVYPDWMRELIISGYTPEEWAEMFGAEA